MVGVDGEGAAIGGDRLDGPLAGQQGVPQVIEPVGPVRGPLMGPPVMGQRLLRSARLHVEVSQVERGVEVPGIEPKRRLETKARRLRPAPSLEDQAEVRVGVGVVGRQAEGLPQHGLGLVEPPQREEGHAEVAVVGRLAGPRRDGAANQLDGLLVMPPLMRQHTEQVQGAGMVGVPLQDAAIDRLGRGRSPSRWKRTASVSVSAMGSITMRPCSLGLCGLSPPGKPVRPVLATG